MVRKSQVTTHVHRLVSILDGRQDSGRTNDVYEFFPYTSAIWASYPRDGHETSRALPLFHSTLTLGSVLSNSPPTSSAKKNMVDILERTMAQPYIVINNATSEERSSSRSALHPYEIRTLRASTQFSLHPLKCESRDHVVKCENTHRTPHTKCLQPKTTVGSNTY